MTVLVADEADEDESGVPVLGLVVAVMVMTNQPKSPRVSLPPKKCYHRIENLEYIFLQDGILIFRQRRTYIMVSAISTTS